MNDYIYDYDADDEQTADEFATAWTLATDYADRPAYHR